MGQSLFSFEFYFIGSISKPNPKQRKQQLKLFYLHSSPINGPNSLLIKSTTQQQYVAVDREIYVVISIIQVYNIQEQINNKMNFFVQIIPYEETLRIKHSQKAEKTPQSVRQASAQKSQQWVFKKQVKKVWKISETRRYIKFLEAKRDLMLLDNKQKKRLKINVLMSNAVKTRTPIQCHSHHQKVMIKYGSVDNIIKQNSHLLIKKNKYIQKVNQSSQNTTQTNQHDGDKTEKHIQEQNNNQEGQLLSQWCQFLEKNIFQGCHSSEFDN